MSQGRTVKVYLVDGKSTGILTAEIMNWTGHVLCAPRTRFEDALLREELRRTGVYLLIGPDADTELARVYVGEGDEVGKRLYSHNREKDFWETFVSVSSKDMNLTKAHVRYLEGRLIQMLERSKKAIIENSSRPTIALLPEADISDMESFLREVELVLPVVGIDVLRHASEKSPTENTAKKVSGQQISERGVTQFVLAYYPGGVSGTAREQDGEFILNAGAVGLLREGPSFHERNRIVRDAALTSGQIKKISEDRFQLVDNMSFTSPSAASVFLFGTSRNGRTDWLLPDSRITYGEWKLSLIDGNKIDQ